MPLANQPEDLSRLLAEIERRLRILEATSPLTSASIQDGALRVLDASLGQRVVTGKQTDGTFGIWCYDAAGNVVLKLDDTGLRLLDDTAVPRARLGYISAGSGYGVSVWDAAAGLRFEVNDDGYVDPWLDHPWRNIVAPDFVTVTDAAFVDCWGSQVELITHKGVSTSAAWRTDAGTTGEVRLRNLATGTTTSAVALAAASSGEQQFQWLHGSDLGGGPVKFLLQIRRTGGAGNVYLDTPISGCHMADPLACDADGIP